MEIFPIKMAVLLLRALVFGGGVAGIYGLFLVMRILLGESADVGTDVPVSRRKIPVLGRNAELRDHPRARATVTFFGDLLCILFIATGVTVLNYAYNYGEFRAFTLLGAIMGFFACRFSVIRLVEVLVKRVAVEIKYIICSIFAVLGYPFYKIGGFLAKIVRKLIFLYSFTLEKKSKKVYNVDEKVYLFKMAVKRSVDKSKNDTGSVK